MTVFLILICVIILFFAGWLFMIAPAKRPKDSEKITDFKYAHRGLHDREKHIPENSMSAFRRAANRGYGIELDLHLTKDNGLAVIHDTSLKRTAGEDTAITELSLAEAMNYSLESTAEKLPAFSQVLREIKGKVPLLVELKVDGNNHVRLCDRVMQELKDYNGSFAIQSFDPRAVRYLKRRYPKVMRGQLAGFLRKSGDDLHHFLDFCLRNLLTNFLTRPHFIAYRVQDTDGASISLCRKFFKAIEFNWTIRNEKQKKTAQNNGAVPIFEYI